MLDRKIRKVNMPLFLGRDVKEETGGNADNWKESNEESKAQ